MLLKINHKNRRDTKYLPLAIKMFQRLRRSFRRKKASYCINCGHVAKECYHQEYENVFFGGSDNGTQKADELKWLDLDYLHHHQQQHGLSVSVDGYVPELIAGEVIQAQVHSPTHSLAFENSLASRRKT